MEARRELSIDARFLVSGVMLALAVAMAGCGKGEVTSQTETETALEIRGEPIVRAVAKRSDPSNPTNQTDSPGPRSAVAGAPGKPLVVGFDQLASFQYTVADGPVDTNTLSKTASQIPEKIRQFNDQFVSVKGFMLPLKLEKGLVTEFLILRNQSMCCYGTVPRMNEWVSVKMVREGVKPIMDEAVTLHGRLKVGEIYENGYPVGIYTLDGEGMTGPASL